jgi:hypothetical protein
MALFDFLLGKKSKLKELERMSPNDLEKEQLRLEAQQDVIIAKVKTLGTRKDAALKEGAKRKSDLERKAMAVRYKQLDVEATGYVSQANLVSKQIQIIGRMTQMKRQEALLKKEGLWSLISSVDAAELEQFMLDMRTKALQGDREANRLLEILQEPTGEATIEEDKDIQEILAAMETLSEGDHTDAEVEEVKQKLEESKRKEAESAEA